MGKENVMSAKKLYSDALVLTEGHHRRFTSDEPIIIPRMIRSIWMRTSPTTVRRLSNPIVVKEEESIN